MKLKPRYVVDTNVLIAASSVHNEKIDATPINFELRKKVWDWLTDFEQSTARLTLDGQGKIEAEYGHKLGFNDYGRQVVIHKYSTCAVDLVNVAYDQDGHALLDEPLQTIIHDRADRKMVAAALEGNKLDGQCTIAFAGDTDWHGWEHELLKVGLELKPIIEDWSRAKYAEKLLK
jgi:hypothetical protein